MTNRTFDPAAGLTPQEMRAKASECEERNERRYHEDEFGISMWADSMTAQQLRLQAEIDENGGKATFWGLYSLATGERVMAKPIQTKYGTSWAIFDRHPREPGSRIVGFAPYRPTRPSTLAKRGYEEREELAPAKAVMKGGEGRGLSGMATTYIATVRTDGL